MGPVAIAKPRAPATSFAPDGWFLLIGLAAATELLTVDLPQPLEGKVLFTSMSPLPRYLQTR